MLQIKWVWKNLKGYHGRYITGLVLALIASAMVIINPQLTQLLIDYVITGQPDASGQIVHYTQYLLPIVGAMCLVQLIRVTMNVSAAYTMDYCAQGMKVNILTVLFQKVQAQDMAYYDRNRTGDLMTRMTGDTDNVRFTVGWAVRRLVTAIFLFVATIIYFFTINVYFTLSMLIITPILLIVSIRFRKKVRSKYSILRERLSEMNTNAQENIEANRIVKAFAREDFEKQKFDEKNRNYREASLDANFTWLRYMPIMEFLSNSLTIITVLVGGLFIILGQLTPGQLSAFSTLSWAVSQPMRDLGMILNDLQRFSASANKVIEMYYGAPNIVDKDKAKQADSRFQGSVKFEDVSFAFGNNQVFDHINFEAKPGETIAIMGSTGSGKTSLVNLIARFYDVTGGRVLVDGVDVRDWHLQSLRSNIGMATQEVFLFSDTIDGNIAYGDSDMPEEDTRRFAHVAAADFIYGMPDGFETIIGERGVGLSGGQKQRLALARALAIKPPILILDDTTSAVDMETEKEIQKNLSELDFSCTKFIIAQRISSVKDADKIIILGDGGIKEMGTHEELLRKRGYYYEIFSLQHEGAKVGA